VILQYSHATASYTQGKHNSVDVAGPGMWRKALAIANFISLESRNYWVDHGPLGHPAESVVVKILKLYNI